MLAITYALSSFMRQGEFRILYLPPATLHSSEVGMAWDDDGADLAAWRLFGSIGEFRTVSKEIA